MNPRSVVLLAGLLLAVTGGCSERHDFTIAEVSCDGIEIEAIERYRRQGFSGHTGDTRYVLVVRSGSRLRSEKEIDVTPVDSVDLTVLERTLPPVAGFRPLAPQGSASRRVFVSPETFSAEEYAAVATCLERHAETINRGFSTPRPPVRFFSSDAFRERWAGLRSVAYLREDTHRNPCWPENSSGFRFECDGAPFTLGVDGHGWVRLCVDSTPDRVCGRAVGRIPSDGRSLTVRSPAATPTCAQGAVIEWSGEDWRRFTKDCRLPSGEALADLFDIRESETLD